jgi:6,7-dimethyl-8-ribityllumazine synthase
MSDLFPPKGRHDAGRGLKLAVVVSRFNGAITARLRQSCLARLEALGAPAPEVREVPGAFELPLAAKALALTGRFKAVICLGAVLRGATSHYDLVCGEAARGIQQAGLETGLPVIFGVVTCDTLAQAKERSGGGPKDAGIHAAEAAVWMARLLEDVRGK